VRAAQKLLGVPTFGGEECLGRGWWWRELKSLIHPKSPECTKMRKNGWFPTLTDLKIAKNAVFYLKIIYKIYSRDVF
jgi:hypothetical protein